MFRLRQIRLKSDIPIRQEAMHDAHYRIRDLRNIHGNRCKLDITALDAADIQHIIDERKQMLRAFSDLLQTDSCLRLQILLHGNVGKADDGIHRGSDIMGHIIQESGLRKVCMLGDVNCLLQFLIDLLIHGSVGQIQNVLFFSLNVSTEYNHPKPHHLSGLLVDILPIPLPLLTGQNGGQLIQNMDGIVLLDQTLDLIDTL